MIRRLLLYTTLFLLYGNASAAACLPGWKYNRAITVNNTNAAAYTNLQVKVIVNTQALIAAGKMKVNGDDIRFTDSLCNNLHYWIDSNLNTTATVIWVKVNNIAASSNKTIYLYYGNYCAVPAQNGDSTFMLFDPFDGSSINAGKWNAYQQGTGTSSVSGGFATLTSTASDNILRSVNTFTDLFRLETKITANSGSYPAIAQLNSGSFSGVTLFTGSGAYTDVFHTAQAVPSCASFGSGANSSGTARANGVWGISWTATGTANSVYPGGNQNAASTPARAASQHAAIGLLCGGNASITMDWCRVRLFAPVDPVATVQTETNQGNLQVSFSPKFICPGTPLTVTFSKNGIYFNNGNTFTIQLSDSAGNFSSPTTLTTITDTVGRTSIVDLSKFLSPGSLYKIRVTSTNPAFSCYTADSSLTVYPRPRASYTFPNDSQCYKYNRYNFTSTSTISSGSISTYIWRWDDASSIDTLTVPTISHSFQPFYAYYYPKLTVTSNLGCKDSISTQVSIRETPDIKTEFNDTIQCYRGNFFIIQSRTVTNSGSITFKSWDFGDGSPVVNNIDSLSHVYALPGIYQVRQINHHSNGCRDTGILGSLVNTHPIALIATNDSDQCLNGNNFIFQAQSTITNGLPLLNYWNIGDGITKDQQDSVHYTYTTASVRNVTLITISDDGVDGCADTTTQAILVNPMPTALINNPEPEKCFNYNRFQLNAKSTIASGTLSHNWNFGDLNTQNNADTVTHTYLNDGVYNIRMYVTSNKGCTDSAGTTVTVRPSPVPSFTIGNDTQCFKYHSINAYSTSAINSGTFSKYWTVSDGSFFTDVDSIKRVVSAFGNYQITLELTSNYNCKDTVSDSVYILPMPQSEFLVNDEDQCLEGNAFTFTDNSTFAHGLITGNKWLFDDGGSALNQNPANHSYLTENAYVPGLIVYADNGCFDTSFLNVKVYPHPGTDFFINDTGQCVNNNSFAFTNNTFISEGGFTNRWFFGDGSPFVDAFSTTKKYNKDSTYLVRVISFSDQGCTDTAQKTVTVFPKAKTAFTVNKTPQCILGNSFISTSGTTLKRGTYTLNWQNGDGTIAGNVSSNTHTYSNVQNYTIRLISTTNEACLDTASRVVTTLPMPLANFSFTASQMCLLNNDFNFNATSTVSNNAFMNHNWYFGDNDSSINSTFAQHSYLTDGTYTVRLISSTNIGGCKDTIEKNFSVFPMPVASFTIDNDRQCFKNNLFGINSTSTVSSGTIDVNNWTFGDGTTSSVAAPSKSYNRVDSFRVSLIVSTDRGCVDSTFKRVHVFPMPVAAFTIAPTVKCLKGNVFKITNKSVIPNGGVISTYNFQYGNGDSSVLPAPLPYSYPVSGDYTVTLRTVSDKGCWDTTSRAISVSPNPIIDFTVDPVCLNDSSVFVNNSSIATGSITSWKWIFGNGRTSTLQSPKHKYRNVGNYDITLIAATDKGCIDTLMKPGLAVVNPNPKAGFFYTKLRSWEKEVDVQYTDTSSGAIAWNWNFSAMGTSTDQNPKLFYNDTLTQLTTLIVTNSFGCRDTTTKKIFIAPDVIYYMPSAFTPNDDNINETFKPIGLAFAINYKFIVFNRWGEILFNTDNPQNGWDGKFDGELVEQDLYFYRLEFVGVDELRHEEKGNIMILR